MSTSESRPPEDQRFSRIFSGTSAVILAVAAACLLVGGFVVCGGTLALPVVIQRQRAAEEAVRRAQAVENLKQIGQAMHQKNAEQDAAKALEATQAGGDSPEPVEPE
jgi:Flp pilus assembly protein TadG